MTTNGTLERIKAMVDTKIKVDFAKFTNDQIINELSERIIKYNRIITTCDEKKDSVKYRYMTCWVTSARQRIHDLREVKKFEGILKIDRIKILELIDLKNKINGII